MGNGDPASGSMGCHLHTHTYTRMCNTRGDWGERRRRSDKHARKVHKDAMNSIDVLWSGSMSGRWTISRSGADSVTHNR